MNHEKDFVQDEIVDLKIKGYDKGAFKYKPTTAGQENEWLKEYMEIDEHGKPKQNYAMLNKLKLNNLVAVPYTKELITQIIKVDSEWKALDIDSRWKLLGQLRGTVFDKILTAINKYDTGDIVSKKD